MKNDQTIVLPDKIDECHEMIKRQAERIAWLEQRLFGSKKDRAVVGMAHPHPRENQDRHGRGPIGGTVALQVQSRALTKPGFNFTFTRRPISNGYEPPPLRRLVCDKVERQRRFYL